MTSDRPNAAAVNATFEFQALQNAENYRAALLREFAPYLRGRVIEIGAGIGQLTEGLLQMHRVKEVLSVEPDPRLCDGFKARLPRQPLLKGTIADVPQDIPWDAILSINVLEHIEQDEQELSIYAKVLATNSGHLCLFVPARPEIYAPIDRDFGHFRRYTRALLESKFRAAGLQIVHLHYFNCIGYFAWWSNFCLMQKREFSPKSVRWFDRIVFPPTHWLERHCCRPPFGQSLIAVVRAHPSAHPA